MALVSALANGSAPGLGDQDIHEVFVAADGFEGDLLAGSRGLHPSLLFAGVATLRRGFAAPDVTRWGLLLVHLLTGGALGLLARSLAPRHPAAWVLAAVAAAPAHLALGGAPTLDPLLLPRGAALPLLLAALAAAIRSRWAAAFALAGLGLAVHAPSAVAILAGLLVAWGASPRAAPTAPAWSLPGASAAVLLLHGVGLHPLRVPDPLWPALQARLAHHLLPGTWASAAWLGAGAWLALAVVSLAATPGARPLRVVLLGLIGWAVLAGVVGPALHLRLLLNLEPWQGARFVVLIALVAAVCAAWVRGGALRLVAVVVLAGSWLGSLPPWRPGPVEARVLVLGEWARDHTPPDAVFVLPPDLPGGFRGASQRSSFGTWKDGGELQFAPQVGQEWARRMALLCGCDPFGAPPPEREAFARSRAVGKRLGEAYRARPVAELLALAAAEGATHVVRAGPSAAPDAHTVAGFSVFTVPSGTPP